MSIFTLFKVNRNRGSNQLPAKSANIAYIYKLGTCILVHFMYKAYMFFSADTFIAYNVSVYTVEKNHKVKRYYIYTTWYPWW